MWKKPCGKLQKKPVVVVVVQRRRLPYQRRRQQPSRVANCTTEVYGFCVVTSIAYTVMPKTMYGRIFFQPTELRVKSLKNWENVGTTTGCRGKRREGRRPGWWLAGLLSWVATTHLERAEVTSDKQLFLSTNGGSSVFFLGGASGTEEKCLAIWF